MHLNVAPLSDETQTPLSPATAKSPDGEYATPCDENGPPLEGRKLTPSEECLFAAMPTETIGAPAPVPDAKPIGMSIAPVVFTAVFDHVAPPSTVLVITGADAPSVKEV